MSKAAPAGHYSASNRCLNFNRPYEMAVYRAEVAMLEQTSIFVLEILPYVIVALCGTAIIPAVFGS
jgi:hypothetical protein